MSILAVVGFRFDGASRLLDLEGDRTLVKAYFSILDNWGDRQGRGRQDDRRGREPKEHIGLFCGKNHSLSIIFY